jgi:hypothetical protein
MSAKPRPLTDLLCRYVQITIAGGVALVHALMIVEPKAVFKSGRNTDDYQTGDGKWCCSGVNVIAENTQFDD